MSSPSPLIVEPSPAGCMSAAEQEIWLGESFYMTDEEKCDWRLEMQLIDKRNQAAQAAIEARRLGIHQLCCDERLALNLIRRTRSSKPNRTAPIHIGAAQ